MRYGGKSIIKSFHVHGKHSIGECWKNAVRFVISKKKKKRLIKMPNWMYLNDRDGRKKYENYSEMYVHILYNKERPIAKWK